MQGLPSIASLNLTLQCAVHIWRNPSRGGRQDGSPEGIPAVSVGV
jgi:hypothetical protein